MMDLAELKFKVDDTEVLQAAESVDRLVTAVEKLDKPITQMVNSSKVLADKAGDLAETMGKTAPAVENTNESLRKTKPAAEAAEQGLSAVEKMIKKAGLTLSVMQESSIQASDGITNLGTGLTKAQSSLVATAQLAGASTGELTQLADILKRINKETGQNPFDKSASGLSRLTQEVEEFRTAAKLQAEGIDLAGKELQEYARDISRTTAAFQKDGRSVAELETRLEEITKQYRELSAEKAKFVAQAKAAEDRIKAEAQALAEAERAAMSMNDNAVELFRQNERAKQVEIDKTNRAMEQQRLLQERAFAQQRYVQQGFSVGSAGRAATLEINGVSQDVINSYLANSKAQELATRQARNLATATEYLRMTEERLDEQLKEGVNVNSRYTDQIVKLRAAVNQSGLAADAASAKFSKLEAKVMAVADKERVRELDNLARAVSVQMGDVGISLASGMNPLLVMIQQGDQIRGAIQQAGASGKELQNTMVTAAGQIASSFVLTGKAIGGFFTGSVMSAGKAMNGMIEKLPLFSTVSDQYKKLQADMNGVATSAGPASLGVRLMATAVNGLGVALTVLSGTIVAGAILALVTLGVAAYKTMKQHDEFVRSLTLTGGALGLNTTEAYVYAASMESIGVSTNDAIKVISAMGKTGELGADSIAMVTKAAVDLEKYGGVAIEDTVKTFAKLQDKPVEALFEVAKQTGMVTIEQLQMVEALKLQGKESDAAALSMQTYASVIEKQVSSMKENYTDLGKFLIELGKEVKTFFSEIMSGVRNLFILPKDAERIVDLGKQIANMQTAKNGAAYVSPLFEKQLESRKQELAILIKAQNVELETQAITAKQLDAAKAAADIREKGLTKEQKLVQEIASLSEKMNNANSADQITFREKIVKLSQDYNDELSKSDKGSKVASRNLKEQTSTLEKYDRIFRDSLAKTASLTQDLVSSEEARLKMLNDPAFVKLPQRLREERLAKADLAVEAERQLKFTNEQKDADEALAKAMAIATGEIQKMQGASSNTNKVQEAMNLILAEGAKRGIDFTEYIKQVTAAMEANSPATKAVTEAKKDLLGMVQKLNSETYESQRAIEEEIETSYMSEDAIKRKNAIRKIDLEYIRDITEALKIKSKVEGEAAQAELDAVISAAKAKRDSAVDAVLSQDSALVKSLKNSLPDIVYDALTGRGADAGKRLRKLLEDEIVRKPFTMWVKAVIDGVSGGVSSVGSSAAGSAASSLFGDLFTTGALSSAAMSSYGTAFGTAAYQSFMGTSLQAAAFEGTIAGAASTGGAAASGSGLAGAGTAGSYAGVAAGVIGGHYGGRALSNGYSTGGSGNANVNVGTAIGFAVGTYLGGPAVGALVGGLIGGAVNAIFGRKIADAGIKGNFTTEGFTGKNYLFEKGGLFRSDRTTESGLDVATVDNLSTTFGLLRNTVLAYGESLGVSKNKLDGFSKQLELSTRGKSAEDVGKELAGFFTATSNEMADIILGITKTVTRTVRPGFTGEVGGSGLPADFDYGNVGYSAPYDVTETVRQEGVAARLIKEGETSMQALVRLSDSLNLVNTAFTSLGAKLKEISIDGAATSSAFIDMFGGADKAVAAIDAYYTSLYSKEEQVANTTKSLQKAFDELGLGMLPIGKTVKESQEAFRSLVNDAIGKGNDELASQLIKLGPTFASILQEIEAVDTAGQVLSETLVNLRDEQKNLEIELLTLQGKTSEAEMAVRSLATQGMSAAEIAAWDFNASLKDQINVLRERQGLESQLNQLTMTTSQLREIELGKLDESNRALQQQIWTLEDSREAAQKSAELEAERAAKAEQIASERDSIERQILEVQGNVNALREMEIAALAESNQSRMRELFAIRDAAAARDKDAEEARVKAEADKQIADQGINLERQLMELMGKTKELRELELQGIAEVNQAKQIEIWAMQDARVAAEESARLAQEEASKQKAIDDQIMSLTRQKMQLEGKTLELRQMELSALDDVSKGIQQQIWAIEDARVAAEKDAAARKQLEDEAKVVTDQKIGLERQLMDLQGETAKIRQIELENIAEENRHIQERIWALQDARAQEEANARAEAERKAADEAFKNQEKSLLKQILELQGKTNEVREMELEGLIGTNAALQKNVWALQDAKAAADLAAKAAEEKAAKEKAIADEALGLERQWLELNNQTKAIREMELLALDESNRARQREIWVLQDARAEAENQKRMLEEQAAASKAIADEKLGLERQILELEGKTLQIRELDIQNIDEQNQALQRQIWAMQDAKVATDELTKANEAKAAKERAIADEKKALERRLLETQGNTSAIRQLDLDALLSDENRAILQQIWALEESKAANEAAANAAQQAADQQRQAAEEIRNAWQGLTDSILDEVKRIRGLSETNSATSLASLQSKFNDTTARARAGDQTAAGELPEISKALLEMAKSQARSLAELRVIEAMTANSLEYTAQGFASRFGLVMPAQSVMSPASAPQMISTETFAQSGAAQATATVQATNATNELLQKLNDNIDGLRIEVRADVSHNAKTSKLLDRVVKDGETVSVSFDRPQKVNVV